MRNGTFREAPLEDPVRQETFSCCAILTRLMRAAVEERKRQERRMTAINAILRLRGKSIAVTDDEIRNARKIGRP